MINATMTGRCTVSPRTPYLWLAVVVTYNPLK